MAKYLNAEGSLRKFIDLYSHIYKDDYRKTPSGVSTLTPQNVNYDRIYLKNILSKLLQLQEILLFDLFFEKIPDAVQFVDLLYFDCFSENNSFDQQYRFFQHFHSFATKNHIKKSESLRSLGTLNSPKGKNILSHSGMDGETCEVMTKEKIIILIKNYFECTQENDLLLKILYLIGMDNKGIVELLLDTKEEDRIVRVIREAGFIELLDMRDLVNRGLYKTLILFDKNELINVFNLPVKEDNEEYTVYSEVCKRIRKGIDVESLCNCVIYVSETFWDLEKLYKFYEALSKLLRSMPKDNDEPSWLVYLKNPPLFFINLLYFFHQMKKQLDYKNPAIIELTKDMLNFCISYVQQASDENFKMNLFDKDGKDMEFLNYAMLIGEMRVLEIERIENLLEEMWDINRDSMQTISTFMRVDSMRSSFNNFSLKVFTKNYETPIEKDDNFQMEFRYVTNSVLMKVLSEIMWPCLMIFMDFFLSMNILGRYIENNHQASKTWLMDYFWSAPVFSIIHIFLRVSQIISIFFKILAIRAFNRGGYTLLGFYKLLLFLYFVQMAVWPLFFIKLFNFFSIVQMIIVLVQVFYVLYKTLSLNEVGVTIRIFGRMALVVLIFGTLSFTVMTVISYVIYACYLNFTQKILGQIYSDLNLFSDMYQGILVLYEFVFGAVVLVRPYQEENIFTYTMTFVMTIFSFFGNIMVANMLIAFLTSQFQYISQNAKYLTMNMQYELIQIYNMKDMDAIFTVPFFMVIPALPWYFKMWKGGESKRKANLALRKLTHIVSFFIPTFLLMMIKLLLLAIWRYLEIGVELLIHIPIRPMYFLYIWTWIFGGPILLVKLYALDLVTICQIMLNFDKPSASLLNFDLEDEARGNLVRIFNKMRRVMNNHINSNTMTIQVRDFLEGMGVIDITDKMVFKMTDEGEDFGLGIANLIAQNMGVVEQRAPKESLMQIVDKESRSSDSNPFNIKYRQSDKLIAPILAEKFADPDPDTGILTLDLSFMQKKFMNNVNSDNVHRLLSFDKFALMKASLHISINEEDIELRQDVSKLSKLTNESYRKLEQVIHDLTFLKSQAHYI
jgi:hypothetical protein